MALDIAKIRSQFPALEKSIYMNTGGTGPLSMEVSQVIADAYLDASQQGPDVPGFLETIEGGVEEARETLARFFGVSGTEIALTRAISEGLSTVAYGMDWQPGDEVIVTDEEHPSGMMIWLSLRDRLGLTIKKLRLSTDLEELMEGLERLISERTKLISVSHVTTDTGTRLPASKICNLAHKHGIPVIFDAAQSAGQFPIDLREVDCDFYAITGHKWLLSGWGVGALYVRGDWVDKLKVSWTGKGAGTWDRGVRDHMELVGSARRFEFGGRHRPPYHGMGMAVEYLGGLGVAKVEERVGGLTARLKAAIAEIPGAGLRSPESSGFSTGIVTFSVDGLSGEEVNNSMWKRWMILGRPALKQTSMRLSVAFFNSEQEIETVISAISTLASEN